MTFPTTVTTADSNAGGGVTDAPVMSLPGSLVNGNIVVLTLGARATSVDATPTGWTEIANSGSANVTDLVAWVREVDATWNTDTTVTGSLANAATWSSLAWQFSGTEAVATQAPEGAVTAFDTATTAADSPLVTPTGGAKDYKWLTIYFARDSAATTTWPTNYATTTLTTQSGGGSHRQSSGERNLNAASENPGAFTISSSQASAMTIAIHPAAGGGGGIAVPVVYHHLKQMGSN